MKHYWDNVEIGSRLTPLIKEPITRLMIAHFAAASDDFSPMTLDDEFAKTAGFGSVFAPNLMATAIAEETLRHFATVNIVSINTTFQRLIWPKDILQAKGFINRRYQKNDEHRVQFAIWVENQNGDVIMKGQAICVLFKNEQEEERLKNKLPALSKASVEELKKRCEQTLNQQRNEWAKVDADKELVE